MRAAIVTLIAVGLAGGCQPRWRSTAGSPSATTSLYAQPWAWTDEHGERVSFDRWRGTELVVAPIYTTCDRTCPLTIARLRVLYDRFQRDHRRAEFVLVTLDPQSDTPAQLLRYKTEKELPGPWHLLTGDEHQTQQLAHLLGIHVMDMDEHQVHDSTITMFDADGRSTAAADIVGGPAP